MAIIDFLKHIVSYFTCDPTPKRKRRRTTAKKNTQSKKTVKKNVKKASKKLVRKTKSSKVISKKKKSVKKRSVAKNTVRKSPKKSVKKVTKKVAKPKSRAKQGRQIGTITHYFDRISVAVIKMSGAIKIGDTIKMTGPEGDFSQMVFSMQIDRREVMRVSRGQEVGLKVSKPVKLGSKVFLVVSD